MERNTTHTQHQQKITGTNGNSIRKMAFSQATAATTTATTTTHSLCEAQLQRHEKGKTII